MSILILVQIVLATQFDSSSGIKLPDASAPWTEHRAFVRKQVEKGLTWQTCIAYRNKIEEKPLEMAFRQGFVMAETLYLDLQVSRFKSEARKPMSDVKVSSESQAMIAFRVAKDPGNALIFLQSGATAKLNVPPVVFNKKGYAWDSPQTRANYKSLSDKERQELRAQARQFVERTLPNDPYVLTYKDIQTDLKSSEGQARVAERLKKAWENGGDKLMPETILFMQADFAKLRGLTTESDMYLKRLKEFIKARPESDASNYWKDLLIQQKRW